MIQALAAPLAGFLWLIVVCGAYLIAYPPGELLSSVDLPSIAFGAHLLTPVVDCVFFLAMAIALRGWGMLVLRKLVARGFTSNTALERELFALPLGATLVSIAVLGGNAIGIVSVWFYAALIVAGCAINLLPLLRIPYSLKELLWPTPSGVGAVMTIVAPVLVSMVGALAPPTQFDSLVYHLALPARYLVEGGMHAVPYSIFSSFPQGMEMLFQAALAVRGPVVASLISWMFYPLTALALYAYCARYFTARLGFLAAVVWLYSPMFLLIASGGYVDCALAFYVFMALFAFQRWRDTGNDAGWLAAGALLCGAACSVKYTGLVVAAFCSMMTFYFAPRGKKIFALGIFAALAGAVFLPWIIKNVVLLHNPIAPWGTGLFPGSLVTAATASAYFAHIAGHGSAITGISDWILLPWHLTVNGVMFGGGFDIAGPLFLLFIPCAALAGHRLNSMSRNSNIIRHILLFICLFAVLWLVSGKVLRFLVPIAPFLSIGAAAGVIAVTRSGRIFKIAGIIILITALAHNMLMALMIVSFVEPARVVLGGEPRREYLGRKLNYYRGAQAMKDILPPGAHVLYVGETRGYYFDGQHTVPTVHDEHPLVAAVNDATDAADAARRLISAGYTHLFYSRAEAQRLSFESSMTVHGISVLNEFMRTQVKQLYADRYCELYEIID